MANNYKLALGSFLVLMLLVKCSTLSKKDSYKYTKTVTISSQEINPLRYHFETNYSYFLYFDILEDSENILLDLSGVFQTNDFRENKPLKIYYIIEKNYEIQAQEQEEIVQKYTILNKNYNHEWTPKNQTLLQTIKNDPLLKLTPGKYRIIFTFFGDEDFALKVKLSSNAQFRLLDYSDE